MKISYISTAALNEATRSSVMRSQQALLQAQQEISSGRKADIGLDLAATTGQVVSLRSEIQQLVMIQDTNSINHARLNASDDALAGISEVAQEFLGSLLASDNSNYGPPVVAQQAKAFLATLTDLANTSFNGDFLFAGINSGERPFNDYFETGASNKLAVDTAFVTAFGVAQNDPTVGSITATNMATFLDGAFSSLFDDPAWSTDWSTAYDTNISARISTSVTREVTTNANIDPIRSLTQALTMVADLGVEGLNENAFDEIVARARVLTGEALVGLDQARASLGITQESIAHANEKMSKQVDLLTITVDKFESVDMYEASTRINSLLTQIEMSYAVTARIQNLSILNHI